MNNNLANTKVLTNQLYSIIKIAHDKELCWAEGRLAVGYPWCKANTLVHLEKNSAQGKIMQKRKFQLIKIILQARQSGKNWRVRCKNSLSDNFGPPFTKPQNYLSSCNAIVAKGLLLCSQHIILAIQMEFPPKEH